MGFTQKAFIRKNTPELRERLAKIGYKIISASENSMLNCDNGWINGLESIDVFFGIDCGTNEELFLAIAALRDDSDYMQ